jgi:cell division protein FtsI/penicillin-binding protein 2
MVIEVPGRRGEIRSADGYVLATSVERLAVQVDTHKLSHPELFVDAAAPILELPGRELRDRLSRGSRSIWLVKRAERAVAEAVRELDSEAVVLVPDARRIYPMGRLAAPVIGFTGREELRTVGRSGFEYQFDELLAGEPETYLAVSDAGQRRVRLARLGEGGRAGYDLELTLDARLQAACEAELARVIAVQRARAASAVVIDVHSGAVLAAASLPSFDPAAAGESPIENWRLRPVQDAFEPGSVVKPIVAATALSAGVVRAGERFDCRRRGVLVAGRWVRDHAEPGLYTLDEVVAESANAGIIEVAERLDPERLWRGFDAFGFGRRTDVGFPAESAGILPATGSWTRMSRASLALGQELTATPLQIAVAYAAIANGGWLLQPRLVAQASGHGEVHRDAQQWRARVLAPELSDRLCRMLESAVEHGTGDLARVPGYRVAGKTGTAQRAVNGSFDDRHHVAWFAGFLPQPSPRLVVVVAVEDPQAEVWGSAVAAPVFARIAEAALCRLGLPPAEWADHLSGGSA